MTNDLKKINPIDTITRVLKGERCDKVKRKLEEWSDSAFDSFLRDNYNKIRKELKKVAQCSDDDFDDRFFEIFVAKKLTKILSPSRFRLFYQPFEKQRGPDLKCILYNDNELEFYIEAKHIRESAIGKRSWDSNAPIPYLLDNSVKIQNDIKYKKPQFHQSSVNLLVIGTEDVTFDPYNLPGALRGEVDERTGVAISGFSEMELNRLSAVLLKSFGEWTLWINKRAETEIPNQLVEILADAEARKELKILKIGLTQL